MEQEKKLANIKSYEELAQEQKKKKLIFYTIKRIRKIYISSNKIKFRKQMHFYLTSLKKRKKSKLYKVSKTQRK